jgi:hypothetical protein
LSEDEAVRAVRDFDEEWVVEKVVAVVALLPGAAESLPVVVTTAPAR